MPAMPMPPDEPIVDVIEKLPVNAELLGLSVDAALPAGPAGVSRLVRWSSTVRELRDDVQDMDGLSKEFDSQSTTFVDDKTNQPLLVIASEDEYVRIGALVQQCKAHEKALNDKRLEVTRPIDAIKARLVDVPRITIERFGTVRARGERAMLDYRKEEERKAAALAADQQKDIVARAEETALSHASQLEAAGRPKEAARIIERAAAAPVAPATPKLPPKLKGVSFRKEWDFAIEDPDAIPREYLVPDRDRILNRIKLYGDRHGIPGVIAFEDEVVGSVRTR